MESKSNKLKVLQACRLCSTLYAQRDLTYRIQSQEFFLHNCNKTDAQNFLKYD